MKKRLVCSVTMAITALSYAGAAGLVIKGVSRSWDEIAKMALKVSGRELTDDAVKSASKTIEHAAREYGDDVAKASVRGGVEVAEQTMKRGGRFFGVLQKAAQHSDESLRALALNAELIIFKTSRQMKKAGKKNKRKDNSNNSNNSGPSEDIPRVLGAVEKNPSVAREFLEHVEKGGKYFVDKVFAVNAKQIMAGGLTAAMIVSAFRATAPFVATGEKIKEGPPIDGGGIVDGMKYSMIILALCVGAALIVYAVRKTILAKERIEERHADSD